VDVEVDTVDRPHGADPPLDEHALGQREVDPEAPHLEEAHAGRPPAPPGPTGPPGVGTGLRHRTRWSMSWPSGRRLGAPAVQPSTRRGQRGAKAQPDGHRMTSRGEPAMGRNGTPRGWSRRG